MNLDAIPKCRTCRKPMRQLGEKFQNWTYWGCMDARCDYAAMISCAPIPSPGPSGDRVLNRLPAQREEAKVEKGPVSDDSDPFELLFSS